LGFAGECELERGRIELASGRLELARPAFAAARELLDDPRRRVLLDAYASLGAGDPRDAIAKLRELIERDEQGEEWWVRLEQAERRWLLAELLMQGDAASAAVVELERALVDLDAIAEQA